MKQELETLKSSGSFAQTLETAINEYACALACIVSLSRDVGRPITQSEAIAGLTEKIPAWRTHPVR